MFFQLNPKWQTSNRTDSTASWDGVLSMDRDAGLIALSSGLVDIHNYM